MKITQTVTLELTQGEAIAYCLEVSEMDAVLQATPDQGNTRTGMTEIRLIRDLLTVCGLGAAPTA